MAQYLVLLETSGNQRYIYSTNKLRENVGASELTWQSCVEWTRKELRAGVKEVLFTSGKAYAKAENEKVAREFIRDVTRRALKDAPGLDLSGVFVEVKDDNLEAAIKTAHNLLSARRGMNPGVESRFRRLPVVAECATSGLPASKHDRDPDGRPQDRSRVTLVKRETSPEGIKRMRRIARERSGLEIVRSVEELDRVQERSWLAVVHADGNGLGKVFLNFAAHLKPGDDYATKLREFSTALDICTEKAFGFALQELHKRCFDDPLPVVPIVLGGDDMTVVMDGRFAVQFTIDFLRKFEKLTHNDPVIPPIMKGQDGKGPDRVTACAGVAVVKPHFPFYAAYELAEELIKSAKKYAKQLDEKKPPTAFDFHILYDASGADLTRIRELLRVEDGVTELVARPYLIANAATNPRTTAALERSMGAIQTCDEDNRRAIPNSHLHDLREALQLGRDAATARYELVRQRYPAFNTLMPDGLFWPDGTGYRTHLLDAIDLVEFWESE